VRATFLYASVVALGVLAAPAAAAPPVCNAPDRLIQWPTVNPVWEMCMRTPINSSGSAGSGIEISDVHYNGHLVMKRAHAPILNVLYQPGACGCFRDWSDEEVKFRVLDANGAVVNMTGTGNYYETNFPADTVCETGGTGGDIPPTIGFRGVAAEKRPDQLVLTTQMTAGWYRYVMRWKFFLDGRIQPWYGYSAVPAFCISNAHTHHNYWRLDFDIDGAANDMVQRGSPTIRGGPVPTEITGKETVSLIGSGYRWTVEDMITRRGYRVVPGTIVAADSFAVSDSWALKYQPFEIDDNGAGGCALNFSALLNNESVVNEDVVLWVRGGQFHQANELDDCGISEYTLEPFGDWSP